MKTNNQQKIIQIPITDLNAIQNLVTKFKHVEKDFVNLRIEYEIPRYKALLKNFRFVHNIALKLIENEAPKFNLFNIIAIGHLEAKVHTPFLAELLNTDGSHRQGRLFFNAFMKHLFRDSFESEAVENISIVTELSDYKNGRMDIVIFYTESSIRKSIVVENKIYSGDEDGQLARYHTYLTKTLSLPVGRYYLIYLTPEKKKPSEKSISPELYKELEDTNSISLMGYYNDVVMILNSTFSQIKAPVVKETVHQYIELIKKL